METILYLLVFGTVTTAFYGIYRVLTEQRNRILSRLSDLDALDPVPEEGDDLKLSFSERLIKPALFIVILGPVVINAIENFL